MNVPVLLITFNRPRETAQVLAALRSVKPARLYVANDGPRPNRGEDSERCQAVRKLISTEIDWPCTVEKLFQDDNLGCRVGVITAINWFFSQVDEGIVLEDDIVPDSTFFDYQEEMLAKYRNDSRVMCISGHQTLGKQNWKESYHFSRFAAIWGWGTWKRVWDLYEPLAESYFSFRGHDSLKGLLRYRGLVAWWENNLKFIADGRLDTWDVQFCYLLLRTGGMCAVPKLSHVQNIGFSQDATHTKGDGTTNFQPMPSAVVFPLIHPVRVEIDQEHSYRVARTHFWDYTVYWDRKIWKLLKRIGKLILGTQK